MARKKSPIIICLIIFLLNLGFYGICLAESFNFEKLFYFREGKLARQSFFSHPSSIDIFAPQNYKADENGYLAGSVKSDLLAFAKKK